MAETSMNPSDSAYTGDTLQPGLQPSVELPTSGRDRKGKFLPGNREAVTHGLRSRHLQEDAAPWRAELIASIRADLGDDVATLKAQTIEQIGTVSVVMRFLAGNLMAEGPLTGKGHTRAAMSAYLSVLDRYVRLVSLVGLERRTKPAVNPADWLEGKA